MIHINSSDVELFGKPMSVYNLMFACTVVAVIIFSFIFAKREKLNASSIFRMTTFIFLIVFIGSINKDMLSRSMLRIMVASMAVVVLLLYYAGAKILKIEVGKMMCLGSFSIIIAGTFAKLGCFFAGCCYGWKYNGFGAVVYGSQTGNPYKGEPLFPIQLLNSCASVVLFIVSLLLYRKIKKGLVYYSIAMAGLSCALLYLNNVLSVAPYNSHLIGKVDIFVANFNICLAISIVSMVKLILVNRKEI